MHTLLLKASFYRHSNNSEEGSRKNKPFDIVQKSCYFIPQETITILKLKE